MGGLAAFRTYEDPAWSWIDLVAACKSGDPSVVRAVMQIAKESNWSHDQWEMAMELAAEEEDSTWHEDIPNNPEYDHSTEEIDAARTIMKVSTDQHMKQQQIDDFFEE